MSKLLEVLATNTSAPSKIRDRLVKFLDGFPVDATSWADATDEPVEMAKWLRGYGANLKLDRASALRSPGAYNKAYREAVLEGFDSLSDGEKERFEDYFGHWLPSAGHWEFEGSSGKLSHPDGLLTSWFYWDDEDGAWRVQDLSGNVPDEVIEWVTSLDSTRTISKFGVW